MKMSPFEFSKAISHSKEELIVDEETEALYNPFIVNKALCRFPDTILPINEMNQRHQLDNALQFSYLINTVRPRNRFLPWVKVDDTVVSLIMEYFHYSRNEAESVLHLFSKKQIHDMKEELEKGG